MSDTDWFIVAFFAVFLVVGVAGMRKVLTTPGVSLGQRMVGLFIFSLFAIVGVVPLTGAVSLYAGRHFAPSTAPAPPPWQYPAGAYYPTFCVFGTVGIQPQPPKYTLTGSSRLEMDRAVGYVEQADWPTGWRRYERMVQKDAVMIGYTNGAMEMDFTFVKNRDGGSECYLFWSRQE